MQTHLGAESQGRPANRRGDVNSWEASKALKKEAGEHGRSCGAKQASTCCVLAHSLSSSKSPHSHTENLSFFLFKNVSGKTNGCVFTFNLTVLIQQLLSMSNMLLVG